MNRRSFIQSVLATFVTASMPVRAVEALAAKINKELDEQLTDGFIEFVVNDANTWSLIKKSFILNKKKFDFSMWFKTSKSGPYRIDFGDEYTVTIKPVGSDDAVMTIGDLALS